MPTSDNLFYRLVNSFLNNKYKPQHCVPTVSKEVIYLSLPFLGNVSVKIKDTLLQNLQKFYPQINFKIILTNSFKIGSFFHFKDQMPTALRSSVVYSYTCPGCQAGYIGSTTRTLKVRTDEHKGQSSRTGRFLHNPPHSAVREHSHACDFLLKSEHFKSYLDEWLKSA